jgi:hypothetical protein
VFHVFTRETPNLGDFDLDHSEFRAFEMSVRQNLQLRDCLRNVFLMVGAATSPQGNGSTWLSCAAAAEFRPGKRIDVTAKVIILPHRRIPGQ